MDQLHDCFNPNILGSTDMSLLPPNVSPRNDDHANVTKMGAKGMKLKHAISEEEMKIRREIEREIERDLEEEIKGGIYQQALRLHRLYQQRKKTNPPPVKSKKDLLELNISITLEGGTKMEIKEAIKMPPPPENFRSVTAARTVPEMKRLDWVKSLRSSAAPPVVGKNVDFHRTKMSMPMPLPANNYSFKRS